MNSLIKFAGLNRIAVVAFLCGGIFNLQQACAAVEQSPSVIRVPKGIIEPCTGNGPRDGVHKQYYEDGKIYLETQCVGGEKQGLSVQYYPGGQRWKEEQYVKGQLEGLRKEFDANGVLKSEANYKGNKLTGQRRIFFVAGKLASEETYIDGKKQEGARYYDKNGALLLPETFDERSVSQIGYSAKSSMAVTAQRQQSDARRNLGSSSINGEIPSAKKYEPYSNEK